MKCLHPTVAYICGSKLSKQDSIVCNNLVFSATEAFRYFNSIGCPHLMEKYTISLPCGKCAACQLQKRKDMSTRLAHEASQHEHCCFITLTYDDEHVPTTSFHRHGHEDKMFDRGLSELPLASLLPRDVQLFMKKLRQHLTYRPKRAYQGARDYAPRIRYFAVGEYGSRTHRPHYHIIIFGWRPSDGFLHKIVNGNPVFRSGQIEKYWKFGYSSFSDVNTQVAKYCARYVTKKFCNKSWPFSDCVVPEFTLQSVKDGGIGSTWFDKYGCDACKVGLCSVRNKDYISRCTIPRYYWSRLRKNHLPLWLELRDQRLAFVKSHPSLDPDLAYDDLCRSVEVGIFDDIRLSSFETF